MQTSHDSHWKGIKRLLSYIYCTIQIGIQYSSRETPLLTGFTVFNWVGDLGDRKHTVGYVFSISLGPIKWDSKKKKTLSLSLIEANY